MDEEYAALLANHT
jgi:hypothetical protein